MDLSFLAFLWRGIAVSHAAVHGGHLGSFFTMRARTIPCVTDPRFRTGRMCAPLIIAWKNALSIGWRFNRSLLACISWMCETCREPLYDSTLPPGV